MSLVESWRKIAQLNLSATSPLDNNNARGFGMALASAAENLEAACTPRAPRVEWFGTGPNQWDSWWFLMSDGTFDVVRDVTGFIEGTLCSSNENIVFFSVHFYENPAMCIPVAREGFPAPVGWHVVGG